MLKNVNHIGNAASLQQHTGARLWASKEDIPYIYGEAERHGIKKFLGPVMKIKKPEGIEAYAKGLKIGDIEVIPTPGHTPGHVCLLYNDILFAGDLAAYMGGRLKPLPAFMNWDMSALKDPIRMLNAFPFRWICPAHGKPVERDGKWEHLYRKSSTS
ncbi:MAG: MBL fold metallo-hydrolase [Firmicutes bacterium]|nr:MBL fold metallo-hydrolase [Bacillota bacterium]